MVASGAQGQLGGKGRGVVWEVFSRSPGYYGDRGGLVNRGLTPSGRGVIVSYGCWGCVMRTGSVGALRIRTGSAAESSLILN